MYLRQDTGIGLWPSDVARRPQRGQKIIGRVLESDECRSEVFHVDACNVDNGFCNLFSKWTAGKDRVGFSPPDVAGRGQRRLLPALRGENYRLGCPWCLQE
jgi:hypothetical protein